MDDVKGFVTKYWPYIVGGIVGLYLILRFSGGGSASSSGDSGYAAFLQAQTAAGAQNAALQLQANAQAAQLALDSKALDSQIAIEQAKLNVQREFNYSTAFNDFQLTQAAMAESIGSSTAQVIDALNAPSITAMEAAAYENAAALEAAGVVAAQSFYTQGGIVEQSTKTAGTMAQALTQGIGALGSTSGEAPKSKWETGLEYGSRAVAAYYTGGASEVTRNWGGGGAGTMPDGSGWRPQPVAQQGGYLAGDRYSRGSYYGQ